MRKIIIWNMITLDGLFEGGSKGELDWHVYDQELEKYDIESQLSADTVLFGRVTYEGMASYWPTAEGQSAEFMNRVPKIVFSRSLKKADWNNTRLVNENVPEEILKLKQQPGGNIFVFGSADFSATLIQHDLVDEFRFGLNPIILGNGTHFFKGGHKRIDLDLLMAKTLKSGLVILHYAPK